MGLQRGDVPAERADARPSLRVGLELALQLRRGALHGPDVHGHVVRHVLSVRVADDVLHRLCVFLAARDEGRAAREYGSLVRWGVGAEEGS